MAFTKLNYGRDWTKAEDFPTYQSDEAQVRADLQYHPDAVKDYINNTLLKALEAKKAASALGAMDGEAAATIQNVLNSHAERIAQLAEDIREAASGGVPSVVQSTTVNFEADSWATATDGTPRLSIPKTSHKRENANFGYNLYHKDGNVYRSGTWGTASTRVVYHNSGVITVTADEAYSGKIVFFGL